jgi:hypothetical protein
MKPIFARAITIFLAIAAIFAAPAKASYVTFDPPTSRFTNPFAINDKGQITGYWFDGKLYHGFLREPDGTITSFDPPNSVATTPLSITDKGVIAGIYEEDRDGFDYYHGFIRRPNGSIISYDAPGSGGYTAIQAINQDKSFVGYYEDSQTGRTHGFVQDAAGNFASFDPPNSLATYNWAINDGGTTTGYYVYEGAGCGNGVFGGFVRAPDGTLTTYVIDAGVNPAGINSHDVIAGDYIGDGCHVDGYVRQADGKVETFDYPGESCCTYVQGFNKRGTLVGYFMDPQDHVYGYSRTKSGKFTLIQPAPDVQCEALGINAGGQITGWYTDDTGLHGFLYTP